ncbi:hypothetical protein B296_00023981 [Ensete ventricosum]|uniref:Uncharacterized protein n=1 Tax=Ensete ventricosum TaxID=4639 RepID=A0A426YHA2_ENSVE|nr:hypothetical protein B296_00023981 [Ensete ventricosum]
MFTLIYVPLKGRLAYSLGGSTAYSRSRNNVVHINLPSMVAKDHFSFSSSLCSAFGSHTSRSLRPFLLPYRLGQNDLARSKEALQEDLPKRAIEEYKESLGFEMGLVRMGRVSLEYGYQLALTRLQAWHPGVEIELDPFITLPEDADVTMVDEQPFDDSLPSPEE